MGTVSTISAKLSNGKFGTIYCHWDGYPSNNGRILIESYTTQEKVDALIALGDLSSLGAEVDCQEGHSFDAPAVDRCVAFGRDRGESDSEAVISDSLLGSLIQYGRCGQSWQYLWDGEKWMFRHHHSDTGRRQDSFLPLTIEHCK